MVEPLALNYVVYYRRKLKRIGKGWKNTGVVYDRLLLLF